MGIPSTSEDIEERRNDARFCDRETAPDLKALKAAPVSKRAAKSQGPNIVDRLQRKVRQQESHIAKLKKMLRAAEEKAAAERRHFQQLKDRSNKTSNLLLQAENQRLRAELQDKNKELEETRRLAMRNLFGNNG